MTGSPVVTISSFKLGNWSNIMYNVQHFGYFFFFFYCELPKLITNLLKDAMMITPKELHGLKKEVIELKQLYRVPPL